MAIESDPTTSSAASAAHERDRETAEKMDESEYLAQQANAAREALSRTARELMNKLGQGVDPRELAKQHPWLTLAAAAAGGFAAASIAVPSKEQQALKRLGEMERAVGIGRNGNGQSRQDDHDAGARQYARGETSFWTGMAKQVLEAVKPALLSALTAGITARAAKPTAEEIAAAQAAPPPPAPPSSPDC